MANTAWGIDIGNRALKAIKLIRDGSGHLHIDDFEVIEHEQVLSQSGDNRDSLIQTSLANFVQRHPTKGAAAAVSVSGQASFARFIKLPPVETKKIPEIVRFEAIQQIPFPLDDVEWSYQLFQTPDSPDVEVGIFAMRKELVNHQIKFFTDIDINVQAVQMNPLAVYNAMFYDGRITGTTMIIDMGAENTDLIIADPHTVWLRSIPIGGNAFTEVLVKQFKLSFAKAEELKRNAATSKYARQIFQAMRPVFADLVGEVQRSIGFYASVHRDARIKKVIALGGTFRLPGLQKYLQQNMQLDVERMDRISAGSPSDGKLATTFSENLLSLISAYGLAVQGMNEGKITSSLLPEKIRREKMWRDKTKWFGAAAACFCAGTAVAIGSYYFRDFQFKQNAIQYTPLINQVDRDAVRLDKAWSEIESGGAPDRQRIQNIRSLQDYRFVWPRLLDDIYTGLPKPDPGVMKLPRAQRAIVRIDGITSVYMPDLSATLAGAAAATALPGVVATPVAPPPTGTTPGAVQRGFVITITCITPYNGGNAKYPVNNGYELVSSTLIKYLQGLTSDACYNDHKQYYVVRATTGGGANQIKNDPTKQADLTRLNTARLAREAAKAALASGTAPGAVPAPGGPGALAPPPPPGLGGGPAFPGLPGMTVTTADQAAAFVDPQTVPLGQPYFAANGTPNGELVLDDWIVQVAVVVALDPPPPAPKTTASAAAQ